MKNLVMSVATNYDWYTIEPFVTSFKRYCKNTDLVLFVDNISDFTRAALHREGVHLNSIPENLSDKFVINVRWKLYEDFLYEHGGNYNQVLVADIRDVIFQGDVFETYKNQGAYIGYSVEDGAIRPTGGKPLNDYNWIKSFFGEAEADKLADKPAICAGTLIGTIEELKVISGKMYKMLDKSNKFGDDQAVLNYFFYEKLVPVKNIIKIDPQNGDIFTMALSDNPKNYDEKILRGDGGVPAVVHQYDRHPDLVQLVDKLYRDKNFRIDENFTDTRSLLEQILCSAKIGKFDDAYKLFTKYLFGRNFGGFGDLLIKLWESTLIPNAAAELLALSIQTALPTAFDKGFNLGHVNKICALINFSMKTHRVLSFNFKIFVTNIMYRLANDFYKAQQLTQCAATLEFISTLDIPADKNFYLFKAKVYREIGNKSAALTAYEKALDT